MARHWYGHTLQYTINLSYKRFKSLRNPITLVYCQGELLRTKLGSIFEEKMLTKALNFSFREMSVTQIYGIFSSFVKHLEEQIANIGTSSPSEGDVWKRECFDLRLRIKEAEIASGSGEVMVFCVYCRYRMNETSERKLLSFLCLIICVMLIIHWHFLII